MMRLAWVIILLVGVAATTALIRSRRVATQAELFRLEGRRLHLRRQLWDQQLRLGRLSAPRQTELRGQQWGLRLSPPTGRPNEAQLVRRDH